MQFASGCTPGANQVSIINETVYDWRGYLLRKAAPVMISPIPFYYLRHGQTFWNFERKLQGSSDIDLNETGIAQANEAKDKLSSVAITTICCSPLGRARQTAEIVNEAIGCPIVEIADLAECNFGAHEGATSFPWLASWLSGDASSTPPEVEPYSDFIARSKRGINHALTHSGPVLIVAHGGTFMPVNQKLPVEKQQHLPNSQPVKLVPTDPAGQNWQITYL